MYFKTLCGNSTSLGYGTHFGLIFFRILSYFMPPISECSDGHVGSLRDKYKYIEIYVLETSIIIPKQNDCHLNLSKLFCFSASSAYNSIKTND